MHNHKKHLRKSFLALSLAVSVNAWATPSYDQLHPYYAEFCAVTQITPIGSEKGGRGGHGVLYLKGACRDTSRGYPRLKVCDEGSIDLSNPEAGAAISVDKMFKNVNWVGSDGKSLLTTGGVSADQALDAATQEKVIQNVLSQGLLKGVEVHETYLKDKPATMAMTEYVARQAVSTDFAMNFGRNVYCTRLPIKKEMLPEMISYLNERNDEYRNGPEYDWRGIYNNCTHTTHNALAAVGIWRALKTDAFILAQAFNLAIPANDFINLTKLGNDKSLNDAVAFYYNKKKRYMLMEYDWMATQPGVLTENFPIHQKDNALYETAKSDFLILDAPLLNNKHHALKRILSQDRYSDIRANLLDFQKKYKAALKAKRSIEKLQDDAQDDMEADLLGTVDFKIFYAKYYAHIEKALAAVEAQLASLDQAK